MDYLYMPDSNDNLFKEFNKDYRHNACVSSGIDSFYIYSEGYKEAAIKLFENLDGSAGNANRLVYPLVFVCRQFLELRLKELIICSCVIQDKKSEFPGGHNLKQLWETYEAGLKEVHKFQNEEIDINKELKRLILQFHSLDPKSDGFRYPVNSNYEPSFSIKNIDLLNFANVMQKLINWLDWQAYWLSNLKDIANDYYSDLKRDYENDLRKEFDSYYSTY